MLEKIKNLHEAVIEKEDNTIYGSSEYIEIRRTSQDYCSGCGVSFDDVEIVYWAPLDNAIICKKCLEPHSEVELRVFIRS